LVARALLLVTCEHGGNRVPKEYRRLFAGWESVLASHRGYDPGALALARDLAREFDAPLVASTVTRLLVELNRSPSHPQVHSEVTRGLPRSEKARIVARYYEPYRREVEQRVAQATAARRRVIHISAHSFVPVLNGSTRNADIGLLYDPARAAERSLCARWSQSIGARASRLRVRRNYPYRGYADGLTTHLRRRYRPRGYVGIEIEVNQKHVLGGEREWRMLRKVLVQSLGDVVYGEAR
jgi:predicted N-formylglutamate amidohydrolase